MVVVVPTRMGQVYYFDASTLSETRPLDEPGGQSTYAPFQPPLQAGAEYQWLSPATAGAGLALSDGREKLYLLQRMAEPNLTWMPRPRWIRTFSAGDTHGRCRRSRRGGNREWKISPIHLALAAAAGPGCNWERGSYGDLTTSAIVFWCSPPVTNWFVSIPAGRLPGASRWRQVGRAAGPWGWAPRCCCRGKMAACLLVELSSGQQRREVESGPTGRYRSGGIRQAAGSVLARRHAAGRRPSPGGG